MNAKKEAVNLINEIRDATDNQLDGYFDYGKAILTTILKHDYTIQQKTRILDAVKTLTIEDYEN